MILKKKNSPVKWEELKILVIDVIFIIYPISKPVDGV